MPLQRTVECVFLLGCCLVTVLCGGPDRACAQQPAQERVYLAPLAGFRDRVPEVLMRQIEAKLRQLLSQRDDIALASPLPTDGQPVPALAAAKGRFNAGRARYVARDFEGARLTLLEALVLYDEALTDVRDWSVLTPLFFQLSVASFEREAYAQSELMIARLLSTTPNFELNPAEDLSPSFRAFFVDIARRRRALPTGRLDFRRVRPDNAIIQIDGRWRGVTPRVVDEVPAGEHWVQLTHDRDVAAQRVAVSPGGSTDVVLTLQPRDGRRERALQQALSQGRLDGTTRDAMHRIAVASVTPWVVSVLVVPFDDQLFLIPVIYHDAEKKLRVLDEVRLDADLLDMTVASYEVTRYVVAAMRDVSLGRQPMAPIDPASLAPPPPPPRVSRLIRDAVAMSRDGAVLGGAMVSREPPPPWYEDPWLWAGVSAGFVAIAVTGIVLATQGSSTPDPAFSGGVVQP